MQTQGKHLYVHIKNKKNSLDLIFASKISEINNNSSFRFLPRLARSGFDAEALSWLELADEDIL